MHQARRIGPKFLLKACMVVLSMAAACDACGDPTGESADDCVDFDPLQGCLDAEAMPIHITLLNTSSQAVHLFLDERGDDFPCCQVLAGISREIPGYRFKNGANVRLTAGRSQVRLNSITCQLRQFEVNGRAKVFTWNNTWSCD